MKPIAWSHSAMSDFENCPKQFFHKRIAKDVVDVQGDAASWGDRVHKFFEYSVKQHLGQPLPEDAAEILAGRAIEFAAYVPRVERLLASPGQIFAEQQLAINKRLQPCDWFDPDVWCRGIIDSLRFEGHWAEAIDWKTGKRKPNSRQLKLFALLLFLHYPQLETVSTAFEWLATGERDAEVYMRAQEAALWQEFIPSLAKYNAAFKSSIFPPRKSGLCKGWCPVTSCEFWRPKG